MQPEVTDALIFSRYMGSNQEPVRPQVPLIAEGETKPVTCSTLNSAGDISHFCPIVSHRLNSIYPAFKQLTVNNARLISVHYGTKNK